MKAGTRGGMELVSSLELGPGARRKPESVLGYSERESFTWLLGASWVRSTDPGMCGEDGQRSDSYSGNTAQARGKDRDICLWQLFQTKNLGDLSE